MLDRFSSPAAAAAAAVAAVAVAAEPGSVVAVAAAVRVGVDFVSASRRAVSSGGRTILWALVAAAYGASAIKDAENDVSYVIHLWGVSFPAFSNGVAVSWDVYSVSWRRRPLPRRVGLLLPRLRFPDVSFRLPAVSSSICAGPSGFIAFSNAISAVFVVSSSWEKVCNSMHPPLGEGLLQQPEDERIRIAAVAAAAVAAVGLHAVAAGGAASGEM